MAKKHTKKALFTSVMSLVLCFAMLIGTTFAWFTDSVTSGMNQISAGNLDVELYRSNGVAVNEKVTKNTKLFDNVTMWEPGAVAYENLQIKNEGNLALNYQLALKFSNATKTPGGKTLADVLKVEVVEGGFNGDREAAKNLEYTETLSTFARSGNLAKGKDSKVYGIVIYWEPSSNDNEFNMNNGKNTVLSIDLGVELFATQLENENDSFDHTYDEDAKLEMPGVVAEANTVNAFVDALKSGKAAKLTEDLTLIGDVEIPAGTTSAIDLNGNTLTVGADGGIEVAGNLIVTGTGDINVIAAEADLAAGFQVNEGATMALSEGVTINTPGNTIGVLVFDTLIVDGANIATEEGSYAIFTMSCNEVDITINSGSVTGAGNAIHIGYDVDADIVIGEDATVGKIVGGYGASSANITYYGNTAPDVAEDAAEEVTIRKGTAFEGITQNPNNAKQYYIESKAGLMNLNALAAFVNPNEPNIITVDLETDVNLSGENWAPIDSMWITFNGNNHTIRNLTAGMSADGRRSGFWGYAGAVTINDLILENVTVSGSQAGTFVGAAEGTKINNCYLKGTNTVNFVEGVETWNGIGAISGVLTDSNINVTISEGATVTLNKGAMTTDSGCTYVNDLTGYIQDNKGIVIYNGAITVNKDAVVSPEDNLQTAVNEANNGSTITLKEGNYSLPSLASKEGITIVGEEGAVIGGESATTGFGSNFGKDSTIQNITFNGSDNGVRYSYANGGTSTFDNCTFAGDSTYGFHIDESNGATFIFNNCTFIGFNAFAGDLEKVVFNNCTFLSNGNYGHTNIWSVAEFNNCTWGDKTSVSGGKNSGAKLYFDGVEESYHHEFIGSSESLFAFAKSVNEGGDSWNNQKVLLVNDIDLNNATWTPIGQTGATEFKGIFDGQNYTIKNLKVDSSAQTSEYYSSGLFGWAESNATIQNVNIDGASVVGNHNVAAIVGYTYSSKIINCHVTNANIVCKHANDDACGDKCGLIAGYVADEARITDCSASNSTVVAGRDAGQLVGCGYNVSMSNCSATNVTVTAGGDCTGANINAVIIGRTMG